MAPDFSGVYGPYDFEEKNSGAPLNPATLADWAAVVGVLASVPPRAVWWAARHYAAPPAHERGLGLGATLKRRAVGLITNGLSARQMRLLLPVRPLRLELRGLRGAAARRGLHNFNKMFPGTGFSARWLHEVPQRAPDDPVLVYMHGGGYMLKAAAPQLEYMMEMAVRLRELRVSVLVLDYTVTTFRQFPGQLGQAVACVNTLADPEKAAAAARAAGESLPGLGAAPLPPRCDRIVYFGDSAGGNLAIALAQHHRRPVEGVPPLAAGAVAWATVLISPWVGLDSSAGGAAGSFATNTESDIINAATLDALRDMWLPDRQLLQNPVAHPLAPAGRDPAYWRDVMPARTIAVWGEHESLRDTCREWAALAGVAESFEETRGTHDCMLDGAESPGTREILRVLRGWLAAGRASTASADSTVRVSLRKAAGPSM